MKKILTCFFALFIFLNFLGCKKNTENFSVKDKQKISDPIEQESLDDQLLHAVSTKDAKAIKNLVDRGADIDAKKIIVYTDESSEED